MKSISLALLVLFAPLTWAGDIRPERKSIAYLGIAHASDLAIPAHHLATIEQNLRNHLEMKRFDYVEIDPEKHVTVEQFLEAYQALLQRGDENADKPVWADRADRIARSAYFYQITVTAYRIDIFEHLTRTEGRAHMNALVDFFRLDPENPDEPYVRVASITKATPMTVTEPLTFIRPGQPQLDELVARCVHSLGQDLSVDMRRLPAFRLKAGIAEVTAGGIRLAMGRDMGLELSTGFNVMRPGADGTLDKVGYVKIRDVEESSSYAQTITSDDGFQGDEQVVEHAMHRIGVDFHGIAEVSFLGLLGEKKASVYPGFGVALLTDVGRYVDWNEFYVTLAADFLFLGEAPVNDLFFTAMHTAVGVEKRWYLRRLGISLGARFGISYFIFDEDQAGDQDRLGVGGEAYLGLELFIVPEFSLLARVMGRAYINPLVDWIPEARHEYALTGNVGALITF